MGFGESGGIERFDDVPSLKPTGKPNSIAILYKKGQKIQSRWYDANGRAQRNRDYTDHGNSKQHPIVPHDHPWDWSKTPARQDEIDPSWD
ncbi:MAG: hypothetical protein PHT30_04265 [Bacilli bacterium]|nr:hypothetical protein [Bacilli bacterium]